MYRKAIFCVALLCALSVQAQNLQLHFDGRSSIHGKDEFSTDYLTATFEMFKPDQWGSTFLFVDADFILSDGNVGMMYTEVTRKFQIGNFPLQPLIEYNGGLGLFEANDEVGGYSIPNSYLAGLSYPFQLGSFFIDTYVAYKYNAFEQASHDVQWTVVWNADFFNNKLSLCGFTDVWTENTIPTDASSDKKIIFLAEPQLWYNLNTNLSLGSEIRISSNFAGRNKAYVCPTVAVKWEF